MKVSVIIPTTDKELHLARRCAFSVSFSSYKNTEVIIVNEGKERSEQRNIGIERATGDIIIYLDSDQFLHQYTIANCVDLIRRGNSGVYIPEIIVTKGFFGRLRNFERQFYTGTAVDCVRAVSSDICPRFDTTMNGPEDADFDLQITGYKAVCEYPLYHDDGVTLWEYIRKKAYYTKSMDRFSEKYPDAEVLKFKYRCWTVFTENGKWKRLLKSPLMTACLFLLIIVRGVIYTTRRRYET